MGGEFDAVKNALSGSSKAKKLKVGEVHIRRGHKGGYIAKHVMEDGEGMPHHDSKREYPIISRADLHKHIDEHLPEEMKEIAAAKAGQSGEPQD